MNKVIVTTLCVMMFATTTLLPTKAEAASLVEYALLVALIRVVAVDKASDTDFKLVGTQDDDFEIVDSVTAVATIKGVGANTTDFDFNGFPLSGNNTIEGIVFCRNNGGNVAPGVNPVNIQNLGETSSSTQLLENGKVFATNTLGLNAADLQQFVDACPNGNWSVIYFVPVGVNIVLNVTDENGEIQDSVSDTCFLPNPETLDWDEERNAPEFREYDCVNLQ